MQAGGRHQQAIFRRNPDLHAQMEADEAARRERIKARRAAEAAALNVPGPLPLLNPLSVFAAGRDRFDIIVRADVSAVDALALAFHILPMEEQGWKFRLTEIALNRRSADGFPIFRLWRTS